MNPIALRRFISCHGAQEGGIAGPLIANAAHEREAVGFQGVKRVLDLLQACLGIGERNHREKSEPFGVVADHLRRIFVDSPGEGRALFGAVISLASRTRQNRGGDAMLVHHFKRLGGRPSVRAGISRHPATGSDGAYRYGADSPHPLCCRFAQAARSREGLPRRRQQQKPSELPCVNEFVLPRGQHPVALPVVILHYNSFSDSLFNVAPAG